MNCLYEILAGAYMHARRSVLPPAQDDIGDAEENLESCRASLAFRERDLSAQAARLAASAVSKKALGDISAAKFALIERKRVVGRLDKVRSGIALLDKQLDALKSSELDKELMNSLKLSSHSQTPRGWTTTRSTSMRSWGLSARNSRGPCRLCPWCSLSRNLRLPLP